MRRLNVNNYPGSYMSFEHFLAVEGEQWTSGAQYTLSSVAAHPASNTLIDPTIGNIIIGDVTASDRAIYIDEYHVSATSPLALRIQVSDKDAWPGYTEATNPTNTLLDRRYLMQGNSHLDIKWNRFQRNGMAWPRWFHRGVIGASGATASVEVNITASGWRVTDDFNFSADKVMLLLGDSRFNGTGPTVKYKNIQWQMLRYFRDVIGLDCRYVNKSVSGAGTSFFEQRRLRGDFDELPNVDLIWYSLGVNDASYGVSSSTTSANLDKIIAWKKAYWPNATLVLEGPTPLENNTHEAAAAVIRTAMSDKVTAAADSKIKFFNAGGIFDRTVASNYASTDTAGSRVHPSDAGHAAWYSAFYTWAYTNANLVDW